MWTVFVEGLEFYGYHGVPQAEGEVGHRYRATVRVRLTGIQAPDKDTIDGTLDYAALADHLLAVNEGQRFKTLEAFAHHVVRELFIRFRNAAAVELELAKIAPPMPVIAEMAGVWLEAEREDFMPERPGGGRRRE